MACGKSRRRQRAKRRESGSWSAAVGCRRSLPRDVSRRGTNSIRLAPNHPVYIQYLRQGALLNSAAFAALGITSKTGDPAGGNSNAIPLPELLTGWLQGVAAWEFAYNKIPRLSLADARQSLRNCFRELNRLAVTSVGDLHTAGVTFAHRRLLADMARTGDLSLRVNYYIAPTEPGDELEQLRLARRGD